MWDLSSLARDWTHIPGITRQILNHWITMEVPVLVEWLIKGEDPSSYAMPLCVCVCVFNGTIFIKKASSVPKAEWPVLSLWTIIIAERLPFLSLPRRHLPSSQRDSCKSSQFTRPVSMVHWNMNKNPGHFFHFYYKAHEKNKNNLGPCVRNCQFHLLVSHLVPSLNI